MHKKTNFIITLCMVIIAANLLLILFSWIASAMGIIAVRSLISSEGIRWFMGNFSDIIATPVLAWLLLLSVAYSALRGSGLYTTLRKILRGERLVFKQRLALRASVVTLLLIAVIVALLVLTPHAVLLSPVGSVFPSPFSRSLIPLIAGTITLISIIYGTFSGTITTPREAFRCLYSEMPRLAPLFVLYIFAAQLYAYILFMF